MSINGVEIYPGSPCPHSTGEGCDDYEHRPVNPCVSFYCGWVLPDSPLPEWMKPQRAKVIVLFDKLRWQGRPVDLAVPVGRRIPPRALNWLKRFSEQHGRPLLFTEQIVVDGRFQREQQVFCHGPPAFQEAVQEVLKAGGRLW